MLSRLTSLLRRVRYAVSDLGYQLRGAWRRIPIHNRRRIAVALAAIGVIVVVEVGIVPNLPCSFPGGDECAPAGDPAMKIIPADALAYVRGDLDPSSSQYAAATQIAARVPTLTEQIAGLVLPQFLGSAGQRSDFAIDIAPWFGGEVAVAVLPASASAGGTDQVQLLQIDDPKGAAGYQKRISAGGSRTSTYHGEKVTVDSRGLASAQVKGFLVIGRETGVHEVIDVATAVKGADPLQDVANVQEIEDALPSPAVASAYLSRTGVAGLFGRGGTLASAGALVDVGASDGLGLAVVASSGNVELTTHSVLDPKREKATPGPLTSLPEFEPTLPGKLPSTALAYLGAGPARDALGTFARDLMSGPRFSIRRAGKKNRGRTSRPLDAISVIASNQDLLDALGNETAAAIVPRQSGSSEQGEVGQGQTLAPGADVTPFVELATSGVFEDTAAKELAGLEKRLASALGAPKKASFIGRKIGDVTVRAVRLSPFAHAFYAVSNSLFVLANDPLAITALGDTGDKLDGAARFQDATLGLDDGGVSLLGYLNVRDGLRYAEATALGANPAYAAFADDFRRFEALGLAVHTGDESLDTRLRLLVDEKDPDVG